MPIADMKVAGLSLMIEGIASLTAAIPVIAPALSGRTGTNVTGTNTNACALPGKSRAAEIAQPVLTNTDILAGMIAAQPTAPGSDRLRLSGERCTATRIERERVGISLPQAPGPASPPSSPRSASRCQPHFRNTTGTCYRASR